MAVNLSSLAQPVAPAAQVNQEYDCTLSECTHRAMSNYLSQLGDQEPAELYNMVLSEVERPLLEVIMTYTKNNQSKAAIILGLSRGTLRKKLKLYNLD